MTYSPTCEQVKFSAVYPESFGSAGENEDNDFCRWTPTANLSMTINNPNIVGKIKVGQKYYLDFTLADK